MESRLPQGGRLLICTGADEDGPPSQGTASVPKPRNPVKRESRLGRKPSSTSRRCISKSLLYIAALVEALPIPTGTIPAVVTPFTERGAAVDFPRLDRHVAWLAGQNIRCIAPLGTNGEGPSLALAERARVISHLTSHSGGMAILPGTGCASLPETIELSTLAVQRGAVGVLVAPPSYFPPERDGVERWYASVLDALPDSARVILYHVPRYTGVSINVETVVRLRTAYGERVAGVKDSGRDITYSIALRDAVPNLVLLNGSDSLVADAYHSGASGTISALANFAPEAVEAVRAAIARGETGETEQRALNLLRELVQHFPQRSAIKCLVAVVTRSPRSLVRPPLRDLEDSESVDLIERLQALRPGFLTP